MQAELDAVKAERDRVRLELQESRQQLSRSHASETIDASGLSGINGKLDIVLAMLSAGGRGGKGPEDMSANMFVRKLQTDLSATAGTLSLLQREVEDLRRGGLSTPTGMIERYAA